jgi:hypothetical protein
MIERVVELEVSKIIKRINPSYAKSYAQDNLIPVPDPASEPKLKKS